MRGETFLPHSFGFYEKRFFFFLFIFLNTFNSFCLISPFVQDPRRGRHLPHSSSHPHHPHAQTLSETLKEKHKASQRTRLHWDAETWLDPVAVACVVSGSLEFTRGRLAGSGEPCGILTLVGHAVHGGSFQKQMAIFMSLNVTEPCTNGKWVRKAWLKTLNLGSRLAKVQALSCRLL